MNRRLDPAHLLGVLPHKTLDEANSFGIVTAGILIVVLASMGEVTVAQLLDSIGPCC